MRSIFFILTLFFATPSYAWETPAKGTQLRTDILNAVRPMAEFHVGYPLLFEVLEMREAQGVAYVVLDPLHRNGSRVTFQESRYGQVGWNPDGFDGLTIIGFLMRRNGQWYLVDWAIGPTDVPWSPSTHCPTFEPVLEVCER